MDFSTDLLESTILEHTRILVLNNCSTKIATHLPCRMHCDSPKLGGIFVKHMICE